MAIIYFSSSADSGDGTLREAIVSANDGDAIMPSPTISEELITVPLQTPISVNKNLVFYGGSKRTRLDGQQSTRLINVSEGSNVVFNDFDFVDGYNSTCGGISTLGKNSTIKLVRCFFGGISNGGTVGDVSTPSNSHKWASITAESCVFCGGSSQVLHPSRYLSAVFNKCTVAGYPLDNVDYNALGKNNINNSQAKTVHFVNFSYPDSFDASNWRTWDFRLKYDAVEVDKAEEFEGGESPALDFLRHPRIDGGALGAIEGGWLIVPEGKTTTLTEDTSADYAEIYGEVVFEGVDRILAVKTSAMIAGSFYAATDSNGYAALPKGTELSNSTFNNVDACYYGAKAFGVNADVYGVKWISGNSTIPVLIEKNQDGSWIALAKASGNRYSTRLTKGEKIRVFDGESFNYTTVKASLDPWKQGAWCSQGWTLTNWEQR